MLTFKISKDHIFLFYIILILLIVNGCEQKIERRKNMTKDQIIERLKQIDETQYAIIDFLADSLLNDIREKVTAVSSCWLDPDKNLSSNAAMLISQLNEIAIIPLMNTSVPESITKRVWLIHTITEAELELREKLIAYLDKMLEDKSSVLIPEPIGREEELPKPRRVCDEAYMQMRRLLNTSEKVEEYYLNVDAYLDLTDDEKDNEISKVKKARVWKNFLEDFD